MTEALGEIVDASTNQFVAQCARLHEPPAFGSFVKVGPAGAPAEEADPFAGAGAEAGTAYAVVHFVRTGSSEPGRRPTAFGLPEGELRRRQPQVFELLCTEFTALIFAHAEGGRIRPVLPPQPPHIHATVAACSREEIRALTETAEFARAGLASPQCAAPEELVAASLRLAAGCHDDEQFVTRTMREIALFLRDDYSRLDAILRKLSL